MTQPELTHQAHQGRPPKYPWDEWTDGKEHTVQYGVDFNCMPESLGVLIRKTARNRGIEVAVSIEGDFVHFKFERAA